MPVALGWDWLLPLVVKTVILQAGVLTLVWFLRRSSAATRHLILSVGIVSILALPVVTLAVPSWSVGLIRAPEGTLATLVDGAENGASLEQGGLSSDVSESPEREVKALPGTTGDRAILAATLGKSLQWIGLIWFLGGSAVLIWLLGGCVLAASISWKAREVDDPKLIGAVRRITADLEINRLITLLASERIIVPVVYGTFNPKIILPKAALDWPAQRLSSILFHELAHIQRNDIVIRFLARVSCAFYWFNPLIWMMERRLMIEAERACDNQVLEQQVKPSEYAGHLLKVSEELGQERQQLWALAPMAEGTDFKDRILSVLDPNASRSATRPLIATATSLLALTLIVPVAAFSPWESQEDSSQILGAEEQAGLAEGAGSTFSETLAEIVRTGDPRVKEHAAEAAGQRKDRSAVPALMELLEDPAPRVREHAAAALGEIGDTTAVPALIGRLSDETARVRRHVAFALGQLGDPRSEQPLIDALAREQDSKVKEHILTALGQLKEPSAIGSVLESLENGSRSEVRPHAAYALGQMGDQRSFIPLLEALGDSNSEIRAEAAAALGLLGNRKAVEPLVEALKTEQNEEVRLLMAKALDMIRVANSI